MAAASKTLKVLGIILTGLLYALFIPVALVTVVIWYTFTWPWYAYRGARRIAFPR